MRLNNICLIILLLLASLWSLAVLAVPPTTVVDAINAGTWRVRVDTVRVATDTSQYRARATWGECRTSTAATGQSALWGVKYATGLIDGDTLYRYIALTVSANSIFAFADSFVIDSTHFSISRFSGGGTGLCGKTAYAVPVVQSATALATTMFNDYRTLGFRDSAAMDSVIWTTDADTVRMNFSSRSHSSYFDSIAHAVNMPWTVHIVTCNDFKNDSSIVANSTIQAVNFLQSEVPDSVGVEPYYLVYWREFFFYDTVGTFNKSWETWGRAW